MNYKKRMNMLMAAEAVHPARLMYLSFADKTWLGAIIIKAPGILHAVQECHNLGINPGGEVAAHFLDKKEAAKVPKDKQKKLLSLEECKEIFGVMQSTLTGKIIE